MTEVLHEALVSSERYTIEQAAALTCEADLEGTGLVELAEYIRLVVFFTLTPPQQPKNSFFNAAAVAADAKAAKAKSEVSPAEAEGIEVQSTDNQMNVSEDVIREIQKVAIGQNNLLQLRMDKMNVQFVASGRCDLAEVADIVDMSTASFVIINGRFLGLKEDPRGTVMFLTLLPPSCVDKQIMLHILLKDAVTARVEMAGLLCDVIKDIKEEAGLSLANLQVLQGESEIAIDDDDF